MPETIMRWMKKSQFGLGIVAHFVLRQENGIYITSCGKANSENFIDLQPYEIELVKDDIRARCKKCDFSPRSIRPENL